MTTRNVALAAVIGVLVAAGSVVAAPVAKADIEFECTPGCWGAIAASLSNGQEELRTNYRTRQGAEDAAVLWCDVTGKTNDYQAFISGPGGLSLAESSDGKTLAGGKRCSKTRPTRQSWPVRDPARRSTSTAAAADRGYSGGCRAERALTAINPEPRRDFTLGDSRSLARRANRLVKTTPRAGVP